MKKTGFDFLGLVILPSLILSITASFMFFIVEPITLYSGNIDDLWFDLFNALPILIKLFGICFVGIFVILMALYFICNRIIKKREVWFYILEFGFLLFLITYIQGNFLAGNLPGINGDAFNWRDYPIDVALSILLWVVAFGIAIVLLVKKKVTIKKLVHHSKYIGGAIFVMLFVSLASTLLTTRALEDKEPSKATYDGFNLASTDKNFFIFLVDAVDSVSFNDLLKDREDYKETFKDFTYFPDTMSYYAYTRDSIPFIFSQVPNQNETPFGAYSRKVYSESKPFEIIRNNGYKMAFYEDEAIFDGETAEKFDNMSKEVKIIENNFIKQIVRYNLFKYLPYPLKGKAHIENLSFWMAEIDGDKWGYTWRNIDNYQYFISNEIATTDEKLFHFIHVEGAHIPFDLNENLEPISSDIGTYKDKELAAFTMIKTYINWLKKAGVYDNSSIIVMSDHGYSTDSTKKEVETITERFNPILYIKGTGEKHGKMHSSDKPISYSDLGSVFEDLIAGKTSGDLFENISFPRKRIGIYYRWSHENHMVEYEQEGKAWESEKLIPTGREFNL